MFPLLPERWTSKAVRLAMPEQDWARFEAQVERFSAVAPTHARACGMALSSLMDQAAANEPAAGPLDWMDWERAKTLRLLRHAV